MIDVAQLKKKAAEFEQKRQFEKALAAYTQVIEALDENDDAPDVALLNRVGDLRLRLGDETGAVAMHERAVDVYTDGGFVNNAIALCNKILRTSPGRASVYYKLGKLSARKGLVGDAKQNFLEYADRMRRIGKMDEAFRAMKEFVELCPDQDDVRLLLAEQLSEKGRKPEAIAQLQMLYGRFVADSRAADADDIVRRMKAIDPTVEPNAEGGPRAKRKSIGLVFLDLTDTTPAAPRRRSSRGVRMRSPSQESELPSDPTPVADLPIIDLSEPPASIPRSDESPSQRIPR